MNDTQWAKVSGTEKINRAAQRRAHAAERAALIAKLGMLPEDGTAEGRYAATTGELAKWAAEVAK